MKTLSIDTTKSKLSDIEGMLDGDINSTSLVLSQQLGVNRNFVAFAISCMQKDINGIKVNIKPIADILKIQPELMVVLIEIL
jgi:hypothetical protein